MRSLSCFLQCAAPSVFGAVLLTTSSALASESGVDANISRGQFPAVAELSNPQPQARSEAIFSPAQRHSCLQGYPVAPSQSSTMNRSQVATGLNRCLDGLSDRLTSGTANLATKEDLLNLEGRQEKQNGEIETVQNRIDTLERELNQQETDGFSPTTKLSGQVVFSLSTSK